MMTARGCGNVASYLLQCLFFFREYNALLYEEVISMKAAIVFDNKNILWQESNENNIMQIRTTVMHINELFKQRGYIYLNQIYEAFFVYWDTQRCNHCILYADNEIRFEINNIFEDKPELGYLIDIIW